jgi:hypothetical protein
MNQNTKFNVTMDNQKIVEFLGWTGCNARFRINVSIANLPFGLGLQRIIVAHEGNWTNSTSSDYETVQEQLGLGLKFISKEYSTLLNRTLFSYLIEECHYVILAVPATGEDFSFEIYGTDNWQRGLCLLDRREL